MDTSKYMIIDTSKMGTPGMFITSRVSAISFENNMWNVMFEESPKMYNYRRERIMFLMYPVEINLKEKGVYINNSSVTGVRKVLRFQKYSHVFFHLIYDNGFEKDLTERDIYVSRTTLDGCGDMFDYLNKLAAETGLVSENGINILKTQYEWIDRKRDNVPLAQYVGIKNRLNTTDLPETVIYPFSCNASQKLGVENAMTNQLSIIQGPPGTGKTQTILNIIANVLLQDKTVLVVSNNNSAVENVAEKLSSDKIGLGFLIAQLGRKENKELFIDNQPQLPDFSDWKITDAGSIKKEIRDILNVVSKGFEVQNKLALLNNELQSLKIETEYNAMRLQHVACSYDNLRLKGGSSRLISLKYDVERLAERNKKINFLFVLRCMLKMGFGVRKILKGRQDDIIEMLETMFYETRLNEINSSISECKDVLASIDIKENLDRLSYLSLVLLKHHIAKSRKNAERKVFKYADIKHRSDVFLKEYPIVLSTTYSCKNCISKDMVFDYLIMDEASQVDIATGALALSCATNAVIVGDDKQLPNVVDNQMMKALNVLECRYNVEEKYKSSSHSFLESCCDVFKDAPQTLLREHYRCHPKIIEFCNKMFYDGELITMTKDGDEENVVSVIRTPVGQHAREHFNQREIDVIEKEVMPALNGDDSVGIISPYRKQAECINHQLGGDVASTVHKYQGRECNTVIMSMVDNSITEFSDDANLLNVAVSRAKSKLRVVVTGNDIPSESNVGQLIAYARYNNFEVSESNVHSVFDILYKQYTEERLDFERSNHKDLGELSENVIYDLLRKCIDGKNFKNIGILCHYPMHRLIRNIEMLSEEEQNFVNSSLSHVDFLLYNDITKEPKLCIEVDGWGFHNTDVQRKRDEIKDSVLDKCNLHHVRLSTVDTVTEDTIRNLLSIDFLNNVI